MAKLSIKIRIILETPPAGVVYGLQNGKGIPYQTIHKQISDGQSLVFEFNIDLKQPIDVSPDFSGPIAQGPLNNRFIYINIGTSAGQIDSIWQRRLKIPLTGISKETIDQICISNLALETTVPGTGKDGTPNCATVKPFAGWHIGK